MEWHVKSAVECKEASRPPWDDYFMELATLVKTRSTCVRRQVGAVIVVDRRIVATGYNGAIIGAPHCLNIGCLREELKVPSGQRHELCRAVHAEQNAIIQAARYGISINGATLYCTAQPCAICAKMIVNAGITRVIYVGAYPDELARHFLNEGSVQLQRLYEV